MTTRGGEGTKVKCMMRTGKRCSRGQQGVASKGSRVEGVKEKGGGDKGALDSAGRGEGKQGGVEGGEQGRGTTRENGERGVVTR